MFTPKVITAILTILSPFLSIGQITGLTNLVKKVDPSIIKIYTINSSNEYERQGTGVLISSNGIGITNYHVLAGAKKAIAISNSGAKYPIEIIVDYSESYDLIKFKLSTGGKPTSLASFSLLALEKGMDVFTLGFPNGFEIEGGSTVSTGIISGFRKVENQDLIQTTAPITHGSSGGGLFDKEGKLCGITSGTFASDVMDRHANLNKVIPISSVKILNQNLNISLLEFYEKISKDNLFISAMESYESHDFENAIISFSEHLKTFPDDAVAWFRMGNSFKEIGRRKPLNRNMLERALTCFEFAMDLDTTYYHAFGQSANVHFLIGNKDLALEFAKRALRISSNFFTNGVIGRLYNQIGEFNKAIHYLNIAIQFPDNNNLDFYYVERGIAYLNIENIEEAMADLRKAIEINNNNEVAIFLYAYQLLLNDKYTEACLRLGSLYELNPNFSYGNESVSNLINSYCR